MQSTAALRTVQLPARSAVRTACTSKRSAVRCFAQQRAQQQRSEAAAQQAAEPAASAALALSSLLLAAPALAEEGAVEAAAEAAEQSAGITALGWALVASPLVFYALFNLYRSQVDPKAKFGDALFFFAASIIVANIVSITVFKIRLF